MSAPLRTAEPEPTEHASEDELRSPQLVHLKRKLAYIYANVAL